MCGKADVFRDWFDFPSVRGSSLEPTILWNNAPQGATRWPVGRIAGLIKSLYKSNYESAHRLADPLWHLGFHLALHQAGITRPSAADVCRNQVRLCFSHSRIVDSRSRRALAAQAQ